jgi:release factor glutamine methyltransferase
MTIGETLMRGIAFLKQHQVEPPRLTAELLLCHALAQPKVFLFSHSGDPIARDVRRRFESLLAERAAGKPVQYIIGRQEFYTRDFAVRPGVLIPRPETEHLVEFILSLPRPLGRILDAGVGSGAICVTLAAELRQLVLGVDFEETPLAITRENAARHRAPASLWRGDWLSAVRPRSIDVLVSNPPYIGHEVKPTLQREVRDHEPTRALFTGEGGFEAYRILESQARAVLKPGGIVALEIGDRRTRDIFAAWDNLQITPDLAGRPCLLTAKLPRQYCT